MKPMTPCRIWIAIAAAMSYGVPAGAARPVPLDPFAVEAAGAPDQAMPWESGLSDPAATPGDVRDMELFVGETHVFSTPDVGRIAVGNGRVINAATADDKEVIVFGNAPGTSSLVIWNRDGTMRSMRITVVAAQTRRVLRELASFLERIPSARSMVVGDKVIIEGDDLSEADYAKVATLARRYPQVVDFTEQVGWERMVLMDVKVVEVPRSSMRELGVRWDPTTTGGLNAGLAWDALAGRRLEVAPEGTVPVRPGESPVALPFPSRGAAGYLGINALLSARINAMAQSGEAVVLAEPQLSTRSGSTAKFLAGGEVPYATVDKNGSSSTTFKPYGVTLEITPRVDRSGTIRSVIDVEVSTVDPSVTAPGGPALKVRRTATEFNVQSGETLVLSGFLSREQSEDIDSVPGLSSLPILGALFRSKRFQRRETELAIFVTPVVVDQSNPQLRERIDRSEQLLERTFGAPRLNVPVHPDVFFQE